MSSNSYSASTSTRVLPTPPMHQFNPSSTTASGSLESHSPLTSFGSDDDMPLSTPTDDEQPSSCTSRGRGMVRKTSMARGREPNRIVAGSDPIQVPQATPIRTVNISPTHKQPDHPTVHPSSVVPPPTPGSREADSPSYHLEGWLPSQDSLSPPLSPPVDHLDVFELDMDESNSASVDDAPPPPDRCWDGTTTVTVPYHRRPRAQTNVSPIPRMAQQTPRWFSSSVGYYGHPDAAAARRTSSPAFLPVVAPSHRQLSHHHLHHHHHQLGQDRASLPARAMPISMPTQRSSTTRSSQ